MVSAPGKYFFRKESSLLMFSRQPSGSPPEPICTCTRLNTRPFAFATSIASLTTDRCTPKQEYLSPVFRVLDAPDPTPGCTRMESGILFLPAKSATSSNCLREHTL